ncbi:MAG TPA: stage 0 sporulation family protein [Anaerolineae bacterium]|nr:stage 0 sporulation family protein [Anaerolineae bacterium]
MTDKMVGAKIVAIRFQPIGKVYHFDASKVADIKIGDYVLVSTSRGKELGEVVSFVTNRPEIHEEGVKAIERLATAQEMVMRRIWQERELEMLINCRDQAAKLGLRGVKFAKAEFSYDGSRLTFLYSVEGDESVDLKELRKQLRKIHRKSRIEMRQVGPRDVAKLYRGMGACGMEERCCSKFLTEFSPVSIRMAKAQGVSLNPQEITGLCGRLRCCLLFEYEDYIEARKHLPKRNKRVVTPRGEGKVVDVLPLKDAVVVQFEDERKIEFSRDEIEPYTELQALKDKVNQPCDNHQEENVRARKDEGPL